MSVNVNLNINVAAELVELNKRITQVNRAAFSEVQAEKQTAASMRKAIRRGATLRSSQYAPGQAFSRPVSSKIQLAQPSTLRAPFAPPNKREEASVQSSIGMYVIFANSNAARDDSFLLSISFIGTQNFRRLSGELDFDEDGVTAAYLYTWGLSARAEAYVKQYFPSNEFMATYRQGGGVPRVSPGIEGAFFLKNIRQNNNGNFGEWRLGYVKTTSDDLEDSSVSGIWGPGDGQDETITFVWPSKP
jgi:hypothetical protein